MGVVMATMAPFCWMAANWPRPARAISCQMGVVEARFPHCTVLITMSSAAARRTVFEYGTSLG